MNDSNAVVIRQPGDSDFVFRGALLAEVLDWSACRKQVSEYEYDRVWTRMRLFRTEDEKYVGVAEDLRDLRRVRRKIEHLADEAEVIDFFGHSELAGELYRSAGIDLRREPPKSEQAESGYDLDDEEKAADTGRETQVPAGDGPSVTICDNSVLEQRIESVRKQGNRRQLAALERLVQAGCARALTTVEREHLARLDGLSGRFPNFADFVQTLRRQLALCLLSPDRVLHLPALLLYG